jgi:HPt (histidine-containing phosphotransfer) domain-containing protein
MTDKAAELEQRLATLRANYIANLGERIGNLASAFKDIQAGNDFVSIKDGLEQLSFHAHKIAGTAGTFGFAELGEKGAEIEAKCDGYVQTETALSDSDKNELENFIATCRSLSDQPI